MINSIAQELQVYLTGIYVFISLSYFDKKDYFKNQYQICAG